MSSNIKHDIMDAARHLFSEKGFQSTSMRDIAAVLNISVGNLTYHYKKKEDLIEAIILEDHQKYEKSSPFLSLKDLEQFLQKVVSVKSNRPYYFKHYIQLSQICPAIYKIQVSVLQDVNNLMLKSLENFVDIGILKKEYCQEYNKIAIAIVTLMVHGLPDFYQMQANKKDLFLLDCIWSIIVPYLTDAGQKEYQALIEDKQDKTQ